MMTWTLTVLGVLVVFALLAWATSNCDDLDGELEMRKIREFYEDKANKMKSDK